MSCYYPVWRWITRGSRTLGLWNSQPWVLNNCESLPEKRACRENPRITKELIPLGQEREGGPGILSRAVPTINWLTTLQQAQDTVHKTTHRMIDASIAQGWKDREALLGKVDLLSPVWRATEVRNDPLSRESRTNHRQLLTQERYVMMKTDHWNHSS